MKLKKQRIAVVLVAAGLGLANAGVQAKQPLPPNQSQTAETERNNYQPQNAESCNQADRSNPAYTRHGQHVKAGKLIGKEVKNDQNERLGKVEDLVIDSNYSVNFAIISSGGALGIGDKRIAVPINDLNCSGDEIRLSATKEQLKHASTTPTGDWAAVSGQEWTRDVDCYYGQPAKFSMTEPGRYDQPYRTFERETVGTSLEREPVRAVQGDGARQLINHPDHADLFDEPLIGNEPADRRPVAPSASDEAMQQRIADGLRQNYTSTTSQAVSVTAQDGVVTLRGSVANNTERRNIETTVKQMSGVRRVNNQLTVQTR